MNKKINSKLRIKKSTIANLSALELNEVKGGSVTQCETCNYDCFTEHPYFCIATDPIICQ
jgi:natural product precursor